MQWKAQQAAKRAAEDLGGLLAPRLTLLRQTPGLVLAVRVSNVAR